jgi:dTDP-4-amino-4,6-dideoxygalactose transaminase
MSLVTFNKAWSAKSELDYLRESLATGQTAGDSAFTKRSSAWLSAHLGGARTFLTPSCTSALEMCALLAEIKPSDEVIVPSFTFVTSASAFALFGARIVFADVRSDTLTLDEEQVRQLITPRTRAVVTVHYAGIAPDPAPLAALCAELGIVLIEDAAHALGASFGGRPLGTFGTLATFSFHESKNFSCGEGGALAVNDPALANRAEILREKGTNRSALLRKEVGKYTWMDVGSSYLASDLTAAALLAQLEEFEIIQDRRHSLWSRYQEQLASWADAHQIRQPIIPAGCHHAAHLYYLVFPTGEQRDAAIQWLRTRDIEAYFHYLPLHLSPAGQRVGSAPLGAPVSDDISQRLVRLPLYPALGDPQQERVIESLTSFRP